MPRMRLDPSALLLLAIAIILAIVAYIKDPGLPWLGAKTGFTMLGFILPRLIPALILAGLMQVLVPQEIVARHFGREGGLRGIVIAAFAGVLTPGGPMVTVPALFCTRTRSWVPVAAVPPAVSRPLSTVAPMLPATAPERSSRPTISKSPRYTAQ